MGEGCCQREFQESKGVEDSTHPAGFLRPIGGEIEALVFFEECPEELPELWFVIEKKHNGSIAEADLLTAPSDFRLPDGVGRSSA